jgi:hypothetical protein
MSATVSAAGHRSFSSCDPMNGLLALRAEASGARVADAKEHVERADEEKKIHEREQAEALRRAQEEEEDGDFWGDVESVAKTTATAAGVVSVAASCANPYALGVTLGGAGLMVGAEIGRKAGLDEGVCDGMELTGGVAVTAGSIMGGGAGVSLLAQGAGITAGGATITQGIAHMEKGAAQSDAVDARADARAAEHAATELADVPKEEADRIRHELAQERRAVSTVMSMKKDKQDAVHSVLMKIRG